MTRYIVLVVLLLIMSIASAQRAAEFTGAGIVSCGVYLEDRKTDQRYNQQYTQWSSGYVSAYNIFSTYPQISQNRISPETTLAYLDKYCRDNPLKFVIDGVDSLIAELGGYRKE